MKKICVLTVCILVLSSVSFTGSQPQIKQPDLIISDITWSFDPTTTYVTATVKNQGNGPTLNWFTVKITVSNAGVGNGLIVQPQFVQYNQILLAGASGNVQASFGGTNWWNFSAYADVNFTVNESDETNNGKSKCRWAIQVRSPYQGALAVGNINPYPALVNLEVIYASAGLYVTIIPDYVYLGPDEATEVCMKIIADPGVTTGQIIIHGIYDDGYTVTPAIIDVTVCP